MQILFISDSSPARQVASETLSRVGTVHWAAEPAEALRKVRETHFDVVVIDVAPPQDDLPALLGALRNRSDGVKILVITTPEMVTERIQALENGVDDDFVRPFSPEEFRARIQALHQRAAEKTPVILAAADVEVDTQRRAVRRAGCTLTLAEREYRLLEFFIKRRGQMITRVDIETQIYDPARELKSNAIDSAICALRKKLNQNGRPNLIQTRRGFGYIFNS